MIILTGEHNSKQAHGFARTSISIVLSIRSLSRFRNMLCIIAVHMHLVFLCSTCMVRAVQRKPCPIPTPPKPYVVLNVRPLLLGSFWRVLPDTASTRSQEKWDFATAGGDLHATGVLLFFNDGSRVQEICIFEVCLPDLRVCSLLVYYALSGKASMHVHFSNSSVHDFSLKDVIFVVYFPSNDGSRTQERCDFKAII